MAADKRFAYQQLQVALLGARDAPGVSEKYARRAQDLLDLAAVLWRPGMRSVQAYRLTWEDIDLERMAWVVKSPGQNKGGEGVQPIHCELKELLQRRKLLGGTGPFQPAGRMVYLWRKWKAKNPEFKGWSWHQMRSRVVTELKRMKEAEASKALVGHTKDTPSDLYTHLGIEDHREALNRL